MTLTKAELADLLFEQLGLNKREAKDMVERFFEEVRMALEAGESVKLDTALSTDSSGSGMSSPSRPMNSTSMLDSPMRRAASLRPIMAGSTAYTLVTSGG